MKITNSVLFGLDQLLARHAETRSVKWKYCIARNVTILKPFLEAVRTALKPSEEFFSFQRESQNIEKLADKTPEEKAVLVTELKAKYPTVEAETEELTKKQEELLSEEVEISFYKMSAANLPGWKEKEGPSNEEDEVGLGDIISLIDIGILFDPKE